MLKVLFSLNTSFIIQRFFVFSFFIKFIAISSLETDYILKQLKEMDVLFLRKPFSIKILQNMIEVLKKEILG